jgi:hypothetical protein
VPHQLTAAAPRSRLRLASVGFALVAVITTAAAQSVPPAAQPAPTETATAPAPAAKPVTAVSAKPTAPVASRCTRLPLSDIQVGREETIASARFRLDEYAAVVAKKRGWKATVKSAETVVCDDYLYLPLIGQEYKCLVTATFCAK